MAEKVIELKGLEKSFGENSVLKGISLSVEKGDVLRIIGRRRGSAFKIQSKGRNGFPILQPFQQHDCP